jgi:hypothetical protein
MVDIDALRQAIADAVPNSTFEEIDTLMVK